mmetsp:Transcript_84650/g.193012  ORF Transcript_84650/g.193012 Transcript_84650/m.193012 type:complete len:239 (-) Transcript_84650:44-760(-)
MPGGSPKSEQRLECRLLRCKLERRPSMLVKLCTQRERKLLLISALPHPHNCPFLDLHSRTQVGDQPQRPLLASRVSLGRSIDFQLQSQASPKFDIPSSFTQSSDYLIRPNGATQLNDRQGLLLGGLFALDRPLDGIYHPVAGNIRVFEHLVKLSLRLAQRLLRGLNLLLRPRLQPAVPRLLQIRPQVGNALAGRCRPSELSVIVHRPRPLGPRPLRPGPLRARPLGVRGQSARPRRDK